jgi:hypothetical protein
VLEVDLAKEEVYESRVYEVRPETMVELTVGAILAHPDMPIEEFTAMLLAGTEDAAFRVMAKQNKSDQLLTYIAVGQFAGRRYLLTREDEVEEARYREFVEHFEADALARGVVDPPSIIDKGEWRRYADAERPSPPETERP